MRCLSRVGCRRVGEWVASKLRRFSPTTRRGEQALARLSGAFDISAADSQRLDLFERSVKCGVEFYFFLVRA